MRPVRGVIRFSDENVPATSAAPTCRSGRVGSQPTRIVLHFFDRTHHLPPWSQWARLPVSFCNPCFNANNNRNCYDHCDRRGRAQKNEQPLQPQAQARKGPLPGLQRLSLHAEASRLRARGPCLCFGLTHILLTSSQHTANCQQHHGRRLAGSGPGLSPRRPTGFCEPAGIRDCRGSRQPVAAYSPLAQDRARQSPALRIQELSKCQEARARALAL